MELTEESLKSCETLPSNLLFLLSGNRIISLYVADVFGPLLATTGISQTDPRWRIRLSQAEERESAMEDRGQPGWGSGEGPSYPFPAKTPITRSPSSWREGIAEKQAKQGSTNEEGAWWAGLILPQLWVWQEVGGGGVTRGGGEEITWTTAASQLIERPLGG